MDQIFKLLITQLSENSNKTALKEIYSYPQTETRRLASQAVMKETATAASWIKQHPAVPRQPWLLQI